MLVPSSSLIQASSRLPKNSGWSLNGRLMPSALFRRERVMVWLALMLKSSRKPVPNRPKSSF
jgi:hypothetical protein